MLLAGGYLGQNMKRIVIDIEGNRKGSRTSGKLTFRVGRQPSMPISGEEIDPAAMADQLLQPLRDDPTNKTFNRHNNR